MASSPQNELILASAALARFAPKEWERFVGAFAVYATEQTLHLMQSTLEELPRAQGRAQVATQLHGLMADCLKKAGQLERN